MTILYWKDLMLKSRIKENALARGIELKFAKNLEEIVALSKNSEHKRLIVDLSSGSEFAKSFKNLLSGFEQSIGVIAHVDQETQKVALEVGFTSVIPRSVLVRDLEKLL